jgi:hypothetical protein
MTLQKISNYIYFISSFIGSQNNDFTPAFEGYIEVTSISVSTYTNVHPSAPQDNNEEESGFEVADCFLYLPYL